MTLPFVHPHSPGIFHPSPNKLERLLLLHNLFLCDLMAFFHVEINQPATSSLRCLPHSPVPTKKKKMHLYIEKIGYCCPDLCQGLCFDKHNITHLYMPLPQISSRPGGALRFHDWESHVISSPRTSAIFVLFVSYYKKMCNLFGWKQSYYWKTRGREPGVGPPFNFSNLYAEYYWGIIYIQPFFSSWYSNNLIMVDSYYWISSQHFWLLTPY